MTAFRLYLTHPNGLLIQKGEQKNAAAPNNPFCLVEFALGKTLIVQYYYTEARNFIEILASRQAPS